MSATGPVDVILTGGKVITVDEKFGSWKDANAKHFADGGIFDQIYVK